MDQNYYYGEAMKWKNYARMLEQQLAEKNAAAIGNIAVGRAALEALQKIDPSNYLLVKSARDRIHNDAIKAAQTTGSGKKAA